MSACAHRSRRAPARRKRNSPGPLCQRGGGGGEEASVMSVSAEEGARRREALAEPLPGACPGWLHARPARGMSVSPRSAPASRCAGGPGPAAASSARPRCPSRRSPGSPPRSRDSPGRPRPGPPPGRPRHHPQLCAPSAEGAGQPSASLAGRGPAVIGGF